MLLEAPPSLPTVNLIQRVPVPLGVLHDRARDEPLHVGLADTDCPMPNPVDRQLPGMNPPSYKLVGDTEAAGRLFEGDQPVVRFNRVLCAHAEQ
jgi:hypothetical protein